MEVDVEADVEVDAQVDVTSRLRLGGPVLPRKAKSELFSALFKLHHLAN